MEPTWGLLVFHPQRGQEAAKICMDVKAEGYVPRGPLAGSGNALPEADEWKGKGMTYFLGHL